MRFLIDANLPYRFDLWRDPAFTHVFDLDDTWTDSRTSGPPSALSTAWPRRPSLFDPKRIVDRGTFEDPKRYPDGIAGVWVNGVLSVREGKALEVRAGRALRRGGREENPPVSNLSQA